MKTLTGRLFILSGMIFLTGCFDFLNPANKAASTSNLESTITSSQFSGVSSAVNKISGILIGWPAVSDASLLKAYRVYRVSGSTKTLIASLAPSLTSFMDGTVTPGAIYTYAVHAVDQANVEDSNSKTIKCLSWAGIDSVVAESRSSLLVTLKAEAPVVDEVRIYGQLAVGGVKTLLATATGSDLTVSLTSLRTGFPYIITAQAYVSALAKEDGNDLTFTAATYTQGYDADGANSPQWANVMAVRAFGEAPAAPVHPVSPNKSPKDRAVELTFNAFNGTGPSAKYVITRVIDGFTMDSSVSTACTDTTVLSCRACDNMTATNGVVNCRDTAVAASPARYRYTLSLIQTDVATGDTWIEALPTDSESLAQFSVLVPIPPKNMVLTQRDAANYEMCQQLNKTSDPLNFNRCLYSGIGAVPYSTGNNKPALNLSTGYYDFGYNLFVDRWQMACNWTMASQGGKCGPNHTSGDCIGFDGNVVGAGAPPSSVGQVGDVWYRMSQGPGASSVNIGICMVASSANADGTINWYHTGSTVPTLSNAAELLKKAYTNDPGYKDSSGNYDLTRPGKRAKVNAYVNSQMMNITCQANVDSNYGAKRMPRVREHVVFEAPALFAAEPYTLGSYNSFNANIWATATTHPNASGYYGCERGIAADAQPSSIAEMLDYTNYPQYKDLMGIRVSSGVYGGGVGADTNFVLGAPSTVDCQSRYGVQDIMTTYVTSDVMYFNAATLISTGVMSPFDNGNRDLLSSLSGGSTGYTVNIAGWVGATLPYTNSTYIKGYIPTLGLPILTTSFSSDYWTQAQIGFKDNYSLNFTYARTSDPGGVKSITMRYRWSPISWNSLSEMSSSGYQRGRCVLPAE